ncbi:MAG: hypothetical protein H7222_13090, partial [Methylotenera sp.]|nr:hypothetical protein [Oligoflexia bacterium]
MRMTKGPRINFITRSLAPSLCALSLCACEQLSTEVTKEFKAPSGTGSAQKTEPVIIYAGMTVAPLTSEITKTSAVLHFSDATDAAKINIYCRKMAEGTEVQEDYGLIDTLLPTAISYVFDGANHEGLIQASQYMCKANAVSESGKLDANTVSITFETHGIVSEGFRNISLVRALGPIEGSDVVDPTNLDLDSSTSKVAEVRIIWVPFQAAGVNGSTQFKVVRVPKGAPIDLSSIRGNCTSATSSAACNVLGCSALFGAGPHQCQDLQVAPLRAYDYFITAKRASPSTSYEPLPSVNPDLYRVSVTIPPANMVLLHRDSVNYEMCSIAGAASYSSIDPKRHNSCAFGGNFGLPISTGPDKGALNLGYGTAKVYDLGYSMFIDRFEAACNWTHSDQGGQCGAAMTPGNCFGANPPGSTVGINGNVFYDTRYGKCFLKVGGFWTPASVPMDPSTPNFDKLYTIAPGNYLAASDRRVRPPLVHIGKTQANSVCQSQPVGTFGKKRLLRRREFVAAAAWPLRNEPNYQSSDGLLKIQPEDGLGDPNDRPCNDWRASKLAKIGTGYNFNTGSFNAVAQDMARSHVTSLFQNAGFGDYTDNSNPAIRDANQRLVNAGTLINTGNAWNPMTTAYSTALSIGSKWSASCTSRYGAQDLIGNVLEYNMDEMQNNMGKVSSIDYGADLTGFNSAAQKLTEDMRAANPLLYPLIYFNN